MSDDQQKRVEAVFRDAVFHAIRALNELNDQSIRLWRNVETQDVEYHLRKALEYARVARRAVMEQSDV